MRRYDLDWLRVIVFGLLIFYHIGMLFVPWGFHIKNNVVYHWLTYPMLFLNQWRLPILFIISGMGTYYALSKRTGFQFAWERIKRLLIPLVFGMLFVVPPQVYVELLAKSRFQGDYFEFWPSEAFIGIYPVGNMSWHHLWFLPYLLLFSLLMTPSFLYLRKNTKNIFIERLKQSVKRPLGLFLFIIPLYLIESFVEPFFPVTHALIDDWFTLINGLVLFSYGFILIAIQEVFWSTVKSNRRLYLICGLIGFSVWLIFEVVLEDSYLVHYTGAMVKVVNLWSWILTIFGYAATYLNRPSSLLSYINEAVYPFYIIHQTIIMLLAYQVIGLDWEFIPKFMALALGTFWFSWLIYEYGIRRWSMLRPFFGLRK